VIVSLARPEAAARDGFAMLERRMHLGTGRVMASEGD
jgi:hypothetical protein